MRSVWCAGARKNWRFRACVFWRSIFLTAKEQRRRRKREERTMGEDRDRKNKDQPAGAGYL